MVFTHSFCSKFKWLLRMYSGKDAVDRAEQLLAAQLGVPGIDGADDEDAGPRKKKAKGGKVRAVVACIN